MSQKSSSTVWKWTAGGCGCLLFLVVGAGVALWQTWPSIRDRVTQKVQENVGYQVALGRVQADPRVIEALGTPIEGGLPEQFQVQVTPAGQFTSMTIPLTGPNGTGRVEFQSQGERPEDITFQKLVVWVGGQGFDLLAE